MLSQRQPALNSDGTFASVWFQFLSAVNSALGGLPAAGGTVAAPNEIVLAPTASPFTYDVPANGMLLVSGGVVTSISLTRQGTYILGIENGVVPVAAKDVVAITYTSAPTVVFFPT